jgi:hypothetical protein
MFQLRNVPSDIFDEHHFDLHSLLSGNGLRLRRNRLAGLSHAFDRAFSAVARLSASAKPFSEQLLSSTGTRILLYMTGSLALGASNDFRRDRVATKRGLLRNPHALSRAIETAVR